MDFGRREHKLRIHLKKNEMEIISIKMLFFLGDYVCEIWIACIETYRASKINLEQKSCMDLRSTE